MRGLRNHRVDRLAQVLWPPTRELVPVELDVTVTDNDDPMPSCQVVSVSVNEPGNAAGAAAEGDVVLEGTLKLLLRAEHSGRKANRAYSLTVQCTDKSNHSHRSESCPCLGAG